MSKPDPKREARAVMAQLDAAIAATRRKQRALLARTDQLEFVKLLMPDPEGQRAGDILASRFRDTPFHRYLAGRLALIARRKAKFMALSTPPQHGKSLLTGDTFIPWFIGQHPELNVIYASYSEDRSREVGNVVKGYFLDPVYAEVFPGVELRSDSKAADQMMTNKGGRLAFIGRKGAGTGKPCDLLIVDDPIKGQEEARSPAILKELHEWWDTVLETRCHSRTQRLVIQTRWTLDDLIGRLCDPNHPDFDAALAMRWDYVNIPAVLTDPQMAAEVGIPLAPPEDHLLDAWELDLVRQQFGDRPMATLWPERFDLGYMALRRRKNPRAFEALSMGNPTPDDGAYFTEASIVTYESPRDLPQGMLYYGASDHAVGEKKVNDPACAGVVGVDAEDNLWILPDLAWDRLGPDRLVQAIVDKIAFHKPLAWFGEADLIGKTLGPAIRRRMVEQQSYTMLSPVPVQGDKEAKAANAQARAALGKIRFPAFAPWFERARQEMLRFPAGKHDDFVDFLGILCRGLDSIRGGKAPAAARPDGPAFGTIGWLMADARRKDARAKAAAHLY